MSAALLPPIPSPPHDPTFWLLDGRTGWRAAGDADGIVERVFDRALTLAWAPGSGRSLVEPSGSLGGLVAPGRVAVAPDGSVYLVDPAAALLRRFDGCACRFETVPGLGGHGPEARHFRSPQAIAISRGNLFLCDAGEPAPPAAPGDCPFPAPPPGTGARVAVFALRGFPLRGFLAPPASYLRSEGQWKPVAIAVDRKGRAFVGDPNHGCVHRFSPRGRWERCLPGFGAVSQVAVDCADRIYVLSEGAVSVRVVDAEGADRETVSDRDALAGRFPPLPFRVDAAGQLIFGCCGLAFDACGQPAHPLADPPHLFLREGTLWTEALDSRLYRCVWHRVVLEAAVPAGARIQLATFTSEVEHPPEYIRTMVPERAWSACAPLRDGASPPWDALVRSGGGRFLWLRVRFEGSGRTTPALCSLRLEFPRISLRRYLPAVFGQEAGGVDFTDRFLSLFDTTLRRVEATIDTQARFFDPEAAPAVPGAPGRPDFLSWLASWIGVSLDGQWSEARRRQWVKNAGRLYPLRGTREGLWRQLLLFLGLGPGSRDCPEEESRQVCCPPPVSCSPPRVRRSAWRRPPLILEHYQLRRWLHVGRARLGEEAVLWGQAIVNRSPLGEGARVGSSQLLTTQDPLRDPFHVYAHRFSVFVPACFGRGDHQRKGLSRLLVQEAPAHTQFQAEYVEPRMRIGFQSAVGLDAVVGRYPQGVALGSASLGQASVLGGAPGREGAPGFEVGRQSRVGATTRLN